MSKDSQKAFSRWCELRELAEIAMKPEQDIAFDAYLKSDTHKFFLLAQASESRCLEQIDRIKKGMPSAKKWFACCEDCFIGIFASSAEYTHPSLDSDEYVCDDPYWLKVDYSKAPKNDPEKLKRFLYRCGLTEETTMRTVVREDVERREGFYHAFRKLLVAAVGLARRLKADSAADDLLEALRLTEVVSEDDEESIITPELTMTADEAKAAYAAATRGFAALWRAATSAKMKKAQKKAR